MTKSFSKSSCFKLSLLGVITLTAATLFQSCKKEDAPKTTDAAILSIFNASPTLATFNFYLDQSKVNKGALPFGGGISYFQIKSADYIAKLTTESSTVSLLSKTISLEKNKFYSLFIVDKDPNLDYLLVNDNIKDPAAEKAFIRFINLSPNAPELNLKIKDGEVLFTDKAYKAASDFKEVDPKVYKFQLVDKATGTTVNKTLEDMDIKKGKIYTIIARGLINSNERPLDGQLILNK